MLSRTLFIAIIAVVCAALAAGCPKPQPGKTGSGADTSSAGPSAPVAKSTLGSADDPIVMAFVPSTEAEKVLNSGEELAVLLGERTGLHFETFMATSYEAIVSAMGVNKVHVAWLPPMAYLFAHQRYGAEVRLKVVRNGKATYRGQIVVLAANPAKTLADLKGRRVAFVEQSSASGYLYPRALMIENGVQPDTDLASFSFAGSHDSALLALIKGTTDAACTYDDARTKLAGSAVPDIMQQTRVLAYTPEIPADNVSFPKDFPAELEQAITAGLLALAAEDKGKQIMMDLYEIEGLVAAADTDYDPVRKMATVLNLDLEEQVKKGQ